MKKLLLLLVLSITVEQVWAQTYDTVNCRSNELYYSEWYDTCSYFFEPPCHNLSRNAYCLYTRTLESEASTFQLYNFLVVPDYVSRPLKVRGLAVMHTRDYQMCLWNRSILCHDTSRLPEYLYLYQKVGDSLRKLAEVQWDTATPQILKLPRNHDTATYGFEYCYLYKVYFDTFITVDSVFYIGGSFFNNLIPDYHAYLHLPTFYVGMQSVCSPRPRYHSEILYGLNTSGKDLWTFNGGNNDLWGPFFAIAPDTSVLLEVQTSDSTMGQVEGSGWCLDSSLMTIRAIPSYHHRFTHWNDGDTSNPRTVLVTKDTVFTAYFQEYAKYSIDAVVRPQGAGRVQGTGLYYEGDTAVLKAVANEGYVFYRWNDATRENPRTLVSTQDVTFVAFFNQRQSIEECDNAGVAFTIVPNPARGQVTLQLPEGVLGQGELVLRDESGKELRRLQTEGGSLTLSIRDLAAGAYFVTFVTAQGSSTRKLLVE